MTPNLNSLLDSGNNGYILYSVLNNLHIDSPVSLILWIIIDVQLRLQISRKVEEKASHSIFKKKLNFKTNGLF